MAEENEETAVVREKRRTMEAPPSNPITQERLDKSNAQREKQLAARHKTPAAIAANKEAAATEKTDVKETPQSDKTEAPVLAETKDVSAAATTAPTKPVVH